MSRGSRKWLCTCTLLHFSRRFFLCWRPFCQFIWWGPNQFVSLVSFFLFLAKSAKKGPLSANFVQRRILILRVWPSPDQNPGPAFVPPTMPIPEHIIKLAAVIHRNKSGKYPTTKETRLKGDASSKFPHVACPPGKKRE